MLALGATLPALHRSQFHSLPGGFYCYFLTSPFLCCIILANIMVEVFMEISSDSLLVLENQPATRKKSDVQGFMIDSGPELSPEHDRLSWTRFRFGQLSLIGANWTLISVFPYSLIF